MTDKHTEEHEQNEEGQTVEDQEHELALKMLGTMEGYPLPVALGAISRLSFALVESMAKVAEEQAIQRNRRN